MRKTVHKEDTRDETLHEIFLFLQGHITKITNAAQHWAISLYDNQQWAISLYDNQHWAISLYENKTGL